MSTITSASAPSSLAFHLLDERWIPVRRASGRMSVIAPSEVVDSSDPPITVASLRPDFDAALLQFLIALVQTMMAPSTPDEWRKLLRRPPPADVLRERFARVHAAFFLTGSMPRVFQDQVMTVDQGEEREVSGLLLDRYDAKGVFLPGAPIRAMSLPTVAAALMTLQLNSPVGGRGHMASLRGGGPLTTVALGGTLWASIWNNVLCSPDILALPGNPEEQELSATFPWMGNRTGEDATLTFPDAKSHKAWLERTGGEAKWTIRTDGIHPLHVLWGMSRRVLLGEVSEGCCDITGAKGPVIRSYRTVCNGIRYREFEHPLTPYRFDKGGLVPTQVPEHGLGYRDWPNILFGVEKKYQAARVLRAFVEEDRGEGTPARVGAFGYHVLPAQTVATSFLETEVPLLYAGPGGNRAKFATDIGTCVGVAQTVRQKLWGAVAGVRGGSCPEEIIRRFWIQTEPLFRNVVSALRAEACREGADASPQKEEWLYGLYRTAVALFDEATSAADVSRKAKARETLSRSVTPRDPNLRGRLGLLPADENTLHLDEKAAATPLERIPAKIQKVAEEFWKKLQRDVPARKGLIRSSTSYENVVLARGFHMLRQQAEVAGVSIARDRLAVIAVALAFVDTNTANARMGERLAEEGVSDVRFQNVIRLSGGAAQLAAIRSLIKHQLRGKAPVGDLAESLQFWGRHVQTRWANDYYQTTQGELQ